MERRFIACFVLVIFYLASAVSCGNSDILNLNPVSSISAKSSLESPDDAKGGLNSMYVNLRKGFMAGEGNGIFYMLGTARSGILDNSSGANPGYRIKYYKNTLSAANADIDWLLIYKIINTANSIIEKVPDIKFPNNAKKNNLIAQAYTMRAYMYFVLAKSWGKVPKVTESVKDVNSTPSKKRAPVAEIFNLIKNDINKAVSLFPNNQFLKGRDKWSKPAVNMLKAEVYLWTAKLMNGGIEDVTTALKALNAAQKSDVKLLDNYSNVFDFNNKGNKEIIFAVHFDELEVQGNNVYYDQYLGSIKDSSNPFYPSTRVQWWGPSLPVRSKFNDDDSRGDASFAVVDGDAGVVKFKGTVVSSKRRFSDDIIIYRYTELLLLKAEAKNALKQDPSAEINEVRKRAYGDRFSPKHVFVSGTQEDNNRTIIQERLFELAWEGKRWWTLIRFGKAYDLVPSLQGKKGEVPLLWPIDEQTLARNSKIKQNPGY